MKRAGASRTVRKFGTMLAVSAVAVAGLTISAAPAQAQTATVHPKVPNCWGNYTIYPDGWGFMYAAASTNCDHQATQMGVTVTIRQRDPLGQVWNCGNPGNASAVFASTVTATADTCISGGAGYTYWAYSENWADIDGQRVEFNSGNYNG